MTIAEQITRAKADIDEVHAAGKAEGIAEGKQAEYDAFWEQFQQGGTRTHYSSAFAYAWTDEIYNPKYPIKSSNSASLGNTFYYTQITDTRVDIDATAATSSGLLFDQAKNLKTIRKIIVTGDNLFSYWFRNCIALENLTIEGTIGKNGFDIHWSEKLNKPSITSIINALSTTTTGLTVTFSKTAVDNAFATAEGAADGSTSAEWLALVATRSNWTIALA